MDVMTTAEYKNVPPGSCIHEVRLVYKDKHYSGIWSSMWGSYRVRVPVAICKERQNPFDQLFEYLEQNPPPPPEPESEENSEPGESYKTTVIDEVLKTLAEQGVKNPDVTITSDTSGDFLVGFGITVLLVGEGHSVHFKIFKQQLVERRYDVLKRAVRLAVIEMFPKISKPERKKKWKD